MICNAKPLHIPSSFVACMLAFLMVCDIRSCNFVAIYDSETEIQHCDHSNHDDSLDNLDSCFNEFEIKQKTWETTVKLFRTVISLA
jgi:hypothetical protein